MAPSNSNPEETTDQALQIAFPYIVGFARKRGYPLPEDLFQDLAAEQLARARAGRPIDLTPRHLYWLAERRIQDFYRRNGAVWWS